MKTEIEQIFQDSCEKQGITDLAKVKEITDAGSRFFAINQAGYVEPRGGYASISEFVDAFKGHQQRAGPAESPAVRPDA